MCGDRPVSVLAWAAAAPGKSPEGRLLVFLEVVLLPDGGFGLVVLVGEIGTEAGTEVDMPAPESADGRFGIFVVVSPETAGLTRVFLFSHSSIFGLFYG